MSRTDKDRPHWVATIQDGNGAIDHDHRNGVCVEETLENAKRRNGSHYAYGRHHNCNKSVRIEFGCHVSKATGRRVVAWDNPDAEDFRYIRDMYRNQPPCWSRICDCNHGMYDYLERMYCDSKYNTKCFGHYAIVRDNSVPCTCDDYPEVPTCELTAPDNSRGGWRRYTWGGVPTWYCREVYHRPERARERKLNDMAREYNTYGDIEDDDFVNRQARNEARWMWW